MIFLYILVIIIIYELWENINPKLDVFNIEQKLPDGVKELKILHISDLHNYKFGKNQIKLKKLIKKDYDFVFITGDLIDRRYPGLENAKDLIEYIGEKYPGKIYFVKGNHEKGSSQYEELKLLLEKNSIKILDDENEELNNGINIIGISDPSEYISVNEKVKNKEWKIIQDNLERLIIKDKYNIVLSHRPEYMKSYVKYSPDLVFSGHSHGGQVKLFKWGLYAPNQGFFAKYSGGIFKEKNTTMINSRGLGNNFIWAKRVFNRPHIIEVNLYKTL